MVRTIMNIKLEMKCLTSIDSSASRCLINSVDKPTASGPKSAGKALTTSISARRLAVNGMLTFPHIETVKLNK